MSLFSKTFFCHISSLSIYYRLQIFLLLLPLISITRDSVPGEVTHLNEPFKTVNQSR
jgi:hypothetical protein